MSRPLFFVHRQSRKSVLFLFLSVLFFSLAALPFYAGGTRSAAPADDGMPVLRVYTYDSVSGSVRRDMAARFEELYQARLEFEQPGDTGALFTRLYLERSNPRADVFVGLDQTYLHRVVRDTLTVPYRPESFVPAIPELMVDPEFRVVPFDYGYITLNYDSQNFDGPLPETWQDLTDSRFARSIIMLNPATSSPGRNFMLLTIAAMGEEGFLDFWRQVKPNILTVTGGWSEGYGLYTQGEAPFVVSYDTSPAYHRIFEETDRYRSLPLEGQGYLQVEVAGIVRGTSQVELAQKFIDLLLSPEIQELLPLSQFMYPAQAGIPLPDDFENTRQPITRPMMVDSQRVAEAFETWLERWEEVMR